MAGRRGFAPGDTTCLALARQNSCWPCTHPTDPQISSRQQLQAEPTAHTHTMVFFRQPAVHCTTQRSESYAQIPPRRILSRCADRILFPAFQCTGRSMRRLIAISVRYVPLCYDDVPNRSIEQSVDYLSVISLGQQSGFVFNLSCQPKERRKGT
jgi:hypothetical protein